ncbi:MAG: endolytic transglycosylase MltG [Spirochaetales bacterium]|nr:endolytic transglycosylase MltG [Spirochaetales bacterium]
MKMFRVLAAILVLLFVISIGTAVVLAFFLNSSPFPESEEQVVFPVEEGASFNIIAGDLESAHLIRSGLFLKIFNKITGSGILIKKGSYNISRNLTTLQIVRQLEEGKQKLLAVVIPEGITSSRMDEIFAQAGVTAPGEFKAAVSNGAYLSRYGIESDTLEGFLFPDTYSFQQNYPAEKVASHMIDVFFHKLEKVYPDYSMLTGEQIYEKIVLSSIIEREYRVPEEASKMASVFYNRIEHGWPLQSCATIVYVITEEQNRPHPDRILFTDLEIESEFNTYANRGLPPAPISNPGVVALNAVFNPARTDYMFFVVDDIDKGTHIFTKSLSDHNKARADYISNFRSK